LVERSGGPTFKSSWSREQRIPDDRLFRIVSAVRPQQSTLVPDTPSASTSEEWWTFDARNAPVPVSDEVARFQAINPSID
jgi:pyridoxine 5'-phosphate synthase PdxJ